jgi:hypothetical protein
MPPKAFFNRYVENLVEKAAQGYRKINNWKRFYLFAPP